jgi:hypothetical protein
VLETREWPNLPFHTIIIYTAVILLYCYTVILLYCTVILLYCYTVLIKYNKYNFVYIIILTFFIYNVLETTRVTQFTILHNYLYCYFKNYLYCFSKFDTVLTNINTILKIQLHLYNYFHFHNVLESWIRARRARLHNLIVTSFKKDSLSTN